MCVVELEPVPSAVSAFQRSDWPGTGKKFPSIISNIIRYSVLFVNNHHPPKQLQYQLASFLILIQIILANALSELNYVLQ